MTPWVEPVPGKQHHALFSRQGTFPRLQGQFLRGLQLEPRLDRDFLRQFLHERPVTPEGGLTFEDGISAPGRYVEKQVETDLLA